MRHLVALKGALQVRLAARAPLRIKKAMAVPMSVEPSANLGRRYPVRERLRAFT